MKIEHCHCYTSKTQFLVPKFYNASVKFYLPSKLSCFVKELYLNIIQVYQLQPFQIQLLEVMSAQFMNFAVSSNNVIGVIVKRTFGNHIMSFIFIPWILTGLQYIYIYIYMEIVIFT